MTERQSQQRVGRLIVATIVAALGVHLLSLYLGLTALSDWRWDNLPVHAVVEATGALIAWLVAALLMEMDRRGAGTNFNAWIGGALAGMGLLDGLHALTFAGNTFVWLHSLATFTGGVLFSMCWCSPDWRPSTTMSTLAGTSRSMVSQRRIGTLPPTICAAIASSDAS